MFRNRSGGRAARAHMSTAARAIAPLALAILLTAAPAASDTLMPDELLVPKEPNYKTAIIGPRSYVKLRSISAGSFYPYQADVRYEGVPVKFVEYTVKRGDAVEQGDVLARFYLYASEVDLENARLYLTRALEGYERNSTNWQEAIRQAEDSLASQTDGYERQMLRLRIEKMQLEYRLYCHQQDRDIQLQRENIDEQVLRRSRTELRAPIAGVIDNVAYKRPDDIVWGGEVLISMHSSDGVMLVVDNSSLDFRYNLPVSIEAGTNKERYTITGRVVASDSEIPEKNRSGHALIRLDDPAQGEGLRNPVATVESYRLDGVLLAPRASYSMESGKYYVTKLVDGIVKKRYVAFGLHNFQDAWLLAGVEPGDVLILD